MLAPLPRSPARSIQSPKSLCSVSYDLRIDRLKTGRLTGPPSDLGDAAHNLVDGLNESHRLPARPSLGFLKLGAARLQARRERVRTTRMAKRPDELGSYVLPHAHDEKQKPADDQNHNPKTAAPSLRSLAQTQQSGCTLKVGTILLSSLHDQTAKTCFRYYRKQMLQISVTASKHKK